MEKQAQNTFVAGLNTDRHPLSSQNTELIEAQNIDLLSVGEGYQLILQKREGNEVVPNAGLAADFIPLAVEEFNNVAYILSMNPKTGMGEIGTFPSPDYNAFEFQKTTEIPGVTSIGASTYDPNVETPDYNFEMVEVAGAGTDEEVSGLTPFQLTNAGFTLTNTGLYDDTYNILLSDNNNNWTYVRTFNGAQELTPASRIALQPGQSVTITVKDMTPFVASRTANVQIGGTITVTSVNNTFLTPAIHTFIYHLKQMVRISLNDQARSYKSLTTIGTVGNSDFTIPAYGGYKEFYWEANDPAIISMSAVNFQTMPAGLVAGDYVSFENTNRVITVNFGQNPINYSDRRTVPTFAVVSNVGGISINICLNQLHNNV